MHELLTAGRLHGDALHHQRQDHGRECRARRRRAIADVIRPYDEPLKAQAGFKVLHGNLFDSAIMKTSVISERVSPALSQRSERSERVRGPRRRVRRPGGLSPPHRRSGARHRRTHHPVHARRRADRLSGLGRSGEHAAAGGADQTRRHCAALHRRRPAVRHVGLAVDPQRFAGSGRRRRARAAQDRRPRAHRSQQGHRRHAGLRGANWRSAAPR